MANPFLVLGGIAISVATAAFGILQVPGWVASAQDASAINDVAMLREAQAAAVSQTGAYAAGLEALSSNSGTKMTLGASHRDVNLYTSDEGWCATVRSESHRFFAASERSSQIGSGPTSAAAAAAAECSAVVCAGTAWSAAYYDGLYLAGAPFLTGCVENLKWYWHVPATKENPVAGLPMEYYSARYERTVNDGAGTYNFSLYRDDIARLYIDGNPIYFDPSAHRDAHITLAVPLSAGPHKFTVEYAQGAGGSRLDLSWTVTP